MRGCTVQPVGEADGLTVAQGEASVASATLGVYAKQFSLGSVNRGNRALPLSTERLTLCLTLPTGD
jgi:hypothetical protein